MELKKIAKENGTKVVLDAGGKDALLYPELMKNVDIFIFSPNETELAIIAKSSHASGPDFDKIINGVTIQGKRRVINESLFKKYPKLNILLKKGAQGSTYIDTSGNITEC
jgi:sugar/nucleoside kinase (ribokinase family)